MTFYNNNGNPIFYSDDNEHLFDFNGRTLGYFSNGSVFNYNGNHLGWFENGWLIDHYGNYTFFNEDASGGPMKPMKSMKPMKGMKEMKPMKSWNWSNLSVKDYFKLR